MIGCGEQVTNCHYFIQFSFTLHSLHFELSRIRLSLEFFFFFSTALFGTALVIHNINLYYNTQKKKKRKERNLEAKTQKG